MSDEKKENDKDDDQALWLSVTKEVKPLAKKNRDYAKKGKNPKKKPSGARKKVNSDIIDNIEVRNLPKSRDLDGKSHKKLMRGDMEIHGRLDLHGLNRDDAFAQFSRFILESYANKYRCLLVITGKGNSVKAQQTHWSDEEPGILKREIKRWINDGRLAPMILSLVPAAKKHGGAGAFYVLLRRQRPK